MFLVRE